MNLDVASRIVPRLISFILVSSLKVRPVSYRGSHQLMKIAR